MSEPREAQIRHSHVRPVARGPARPGICWELLGMLMLLLLGWGVLITYAGSVVGWWGR